MKLHAREVPYSSVVGGGLMLLDEQNRVRFQIAFLGTTDGITKEQTAELARQIAWYIDELGMELPD